MWLTQEHSRIAIDHHSPTYIPKNSYPSRLPFALFSATGPSLPWFGSAVLQETFGYRSRSTAWLPHKSAPDTGCTWPFPRLPCVGPASSSGRCARPATALWSLSAAAAVHPLPTFSGQRLPGRPSIRHRKVNRDRRRCHPHQPHECSLRIIVQRSLMRIWSFPSSAWSEMANKSVKQQKNKTKQNHRQYYYFLRKLS